MDHSKWHFQNLEYIFVWLESVKEFAPLFSIFAFERGEEALLQNHRKKVQNKVVFAQISMGQLRPQFILAS